jgi:phosphohistidine phosphatase
MMVYIVRHALAGEHGDPQWPDDSLRPLTSEGRMRFACTARKLAKRKVRPELIVTSPYVRCRETAELLAAAMDDDPPIVELDALTPGSDLAALAQWSRNHGCDELAVVGHAPDVSRMAAWMIGDTSAAAIRFAKGAVAAIQFDEPFITPAGGELQWLVTCKMLNC